MKTKFTILALVMAMFSFTVANAQGNGNGKGNKGNKGYAKMHKNKKGSHGDVIYRDRDDDHRVYRRGGTVFYPNQNIRNLPPGQAKKIYGHQSAKAFAPGQQKKAYNNNIYYPQRRVIYNNRYHNDDYRIRQQGELARRVGSIFGL